MSFASSYDHDVDYAGFYFNAFAFGGNGDGNGVYTSTYNGVSTSWNEDGSPVTTGDSTGETGSGSGSAGGSGSSSSGSSSSGGNATTSGISIVSGPWRGSNGSVATSGGLYEPAKGGYQLVSLDDHDHHTFAREFRKEVEDIAAAAGHPIDINDFCVPDVPKDSVHFPTPGALRDELKKLRPSLGPSNGGAWNSALKLKLNDPAFKKMSDKKKLKELLEWMIDNSAKYGVDLTTLHHYQRVGSVADNVKSIEKFLELCNAVGIDNERYAKLLSKMTEVLALSEEGVAVLKGLGFRVLSKGGKIVGFIGKLGKPGEFTAPLTVIIALAGGAGLAEAADLGVRDLTQADLVEGSIRIVVVEGGSIVSDALIDADSAYKKSGKAWAYELNGMGEEMQRKMLEYMLKSGTQAFKDALTEYNDWAGSRPQSSTPAIPWWHIGAQIDAFLGGANRSPDAPQY